ncbi:MAG: iron chelate uptake ABC transporter family permease subunit [Candidatus Lokiarchaeota archaeon]|nr:iron chelate uptake ABC transporter family permease subunit [Candidatus Lokiarchaeota archaeon]
MIPLLDALEDLSEPVLFRPFITGIIIGVVCGLIGVFMVLKGLVFFGNGIAHSAFAGGALGILLGINPLITIAIFALATSAGIGYIREKTKLTNETAIGIFFAFSMGLGVVFIQLYNTYNTDISSLLFGSLNSISKSELLTVVIIAVVIVVLTFLIKKELYFITFDEELARANGLPVKILNYIFLAMIALTVVMSITTVGVILVMAYVVTPAATAYQFTYKFNRLIIYTIIIASIIPALGFIIAYMFNLSAAATIAILLTGFFGIAMLISPKRRSKTPEIEDQYCQMCANLVDGVNCRFCILEEEEKKHDHSNHEKHKEEEDKQNG